MHRGGDLNLTLGNLGGDLEGLEERGLARVAAGRSRRDDDIGRRNGADTSRSRDSVGKNLVTNVAELSVGEDEADVAAQGVHESSDGVARVLLNVVLEDLAHEGVLAHQNLRHKRTKPHNTAREQTINATHIRTYTYTSNKHTHTS